MTNELARYENIRDRYSKGNVKKGATFHSSTARDSSAQIIPDSLRGLYSGVKIQYYADIADGADYGHLTARKKGEQRNMISYRTDVRLQ